MASKKLTAEQQALFDVLTPLQKKFSLAIIKGKNQTDAYKATKGKAKTAEAIRNSASRMFTNVGVQAFIKSVQGEVINDAIMTYEEAMERLTAMGRTSIADLATFGTHVVGEDDDGNPISQSVWSFKNASELRPEQMAAISELTAGKDGLKIKLHDPKAAIKQLAEMRGWEAPKKTEVTATVKSENVNMTPDEAAEAYKKLMG
ncbi:terminase small subunit [Pectobacterium brasiliense]|uniref:Terminase small subunit n=1 Tax=Pectobacterium brasiliense TaxID=180957 RepID=A0AAW9HIG0_9GAMM|nr:terminase small subunit [Pectobacterium brasiliense]MDY4380356.1 terminase small subunit [Pectobacterium brasiliense]